MISGVQYVVDRCGNQVSVLVPIDEWRSIEQIKEILEHVYLAGLIEDRQGDGVSCELDDLLKMEGVTRDGLESKAAF
ncbi:hypothetical protein [Desulfatirhabdium butyrativorans]|uniref:hypothetical protein n=1 Tax=Desulfatirhabdium butyrativorans TaxID=340467 RepID=UPI0004814246|nr:hypothetical protein [Desulfatirhabdium butyrativorans]